MPRRVVVASSRRYTGYALRLEGRYYYVGITARTDVMKRYREHTTGRGAAWTREHKPIEIIETRDFSDIRLIEAERLENAMTLEYMARYGVRRVRGGSHCQVSTTALLRHLNMLDRAQISARRAIGMFRRVSYIHGMDRTIIHKHPIGMVAIAVAAGLAAGILEVFGILGVGNGTVSITDAHFFLLLIVMIMLVAAMLIYVYNLSTFVLDEVNISVNNWMSPTYDRTAECPWDEIEDVTITDTGMFAQIFGYGTLLIQTAGTRTNLEMHMVPDVQHWQHIIMDRIDEIERAREAKLGIIK